MSLLPSFLIPPTYAVWAEQQRAYTADSPGLIALEADRTAQASGLKKLAVKEGKHGVTVTIERLIDGEGYGVNTVFKAGGDRDETNLLKGLEIRNNSTSCNTISVLDFQLDLFWAIKNLNFYFI